MTGVNWITLRRNLVIGAYRKMRVLFTPSMLVLLDKLLFYYGIERVQIYKAEQSN